VLPTLSPEPIRGRSHDGRTMQHLRDPAIDAEPASCYHLVASTFPTHSR
jgi:hypothetical protein